MATTSTSPQASSPTASPTRKPPSSYATFSTVSNDALDPSLPLHPHAHASWPSRLLLHWVSPLMALGNARHLTEHDLWPLQRAHQSRVVAASLGRDFAASGSLVTAFLTSFGARFACTGVASLGVALSSLVGPFVLHRVVSALTARDDDDDVASLLPWVALLFATQVLQALVATATAFEAQLLAIQFTGALKHLLYGKALTLNANARRQTSVGDITTLYTMDCAHLIRTVSVAHQLWILPLQLLVVSAGLFWLLGVAALAGLTVVALVLYANHALASVVQTLQRQFMKLKDARMQCTTETFRAIGVVKFNAWEDRMMARIGAARMAELASIRQYLQLDVLRTALTAGMPLFVSVVSFAVFAGVLGHALSPALVFTSLALFRLLQQPLRQLAGIYSTVIRARVSAARITAFLALPELAPPCGPSRNDHDHDDQDDSVVVAIDDGAFSWDSSASAAAAAPLQHVTLRIRREELVVIYGPVGCGKSSLCAAILGEMVALRPDRVVRTGRVAYCAQQPWIENLTLRDNILFGRRFDAARYAAVLDACALTIDLASLSAGDRTEIGERGVNLSGGQKARVALARACYADADLYVLDAPLAAVDAIVAHEIWRKCLLGLLRHKTVVLVTHNPEILASEHVTQAVTIAPDGTLVTTMPPRRSRPAPEPTEAKTTTEIRASLPQQDPARSPLSVAEPPPQESQPRRCESTPLDALPTKDTTNEETRRLLQRETHAHGRVGLSVFRTYYAAMGGAWVVLLVLVAQAVQQALQVGSAFWLGRWSSSASGGATFVSTATGMAVYTLLGVLAALMVVVQTLCVYWFGLRAATSLFDRMTHALLHAPLSFFDATPMGRLLGRYAEDVSIVDFTLPTLFSGFVASGFAVVSALLTAAVVIHWHVLLVVPIAIVYIRVAAFSIAPAREIERVHKATWSPLLSHLAASLEGAATVRAFGPRDVTRFSDRNNHALDARNQAWFATLAVSQWFALRVQLLGCGVVLVVAASLVLLHAALAPEIVGLAFAYALGIAQNLEQIVQLWSSIETRMVSPERLHEYTAVEQEMTFETPVSVHLTLPHGWPLAGAVTFDRVSFRYTNARDRLVLRDVSFAVCAREKIGIVGRTGAGKSSLTMALFRINELASGTISIDGTNTSKIGLKTLREKLSIIPQNPVLFKGPLRAYLDPFDEYSDDELWRSISRVGLTERISSDEKKLECPVEENGENFSVGERQMLCMARALLRQSRIVIFDEATAAIDHETDQKLQRVIREAFAESTVLTIAHRLDTILDSDRILVLEGGEMVEFASPAELVKKGSGHFFELMKEGGYLEKFLQSHSAAAF